MPIEVVMGVSNRRVIALDEARLDMAPLARSDERGAMLLLTPVGGIQRSDRTPMNLAVCHADGTLAWALPVDNQRLTRAPTDDETRAVFARLWRLLDDAVRGQPGSGTLWESGTPVGRPTTAVGRWVEYEKPRPLLELAELTDGLRLLVACSASHLQRPGSRLQFHAPGRAISPRPGARIVQDIDTTFEMAHFAILNPQREAGWRVGGVLRCEELEGARAAFWRFPQRGANGVVLCDE